MKLTKSSLWARGIVKVSSKSPALILSSSTPVSIVSKLSKLVTKASKLMVAGLVVIVALIVTIALLVQRSCFHHLYSSNPYVEDAINPSSNRSFESTNAGSE